MGLPVWRAPSPAESKQAIKTDSTAASRSPIRRSPRPHRSNTRRVPSASARADPFSRRTYNASLLDPRRYAGSYSLDTSDRDSDATSRDTLLPPVPELSYDSSRRPMRMGSYEAPAYTRAHLFTEPEQMSTSDDLRRLGTTDGDDGASYTERESSYVPYTRNFAPARYAPPRPLEPLRESYTRTSSRRPSTPPLRPRPSRSFEVLFFDGEEDDAQRRSWRALHSPRRPDERRPADGPLPSSSLRQSWSPTSPVDGLGDRQRSYSPDDNWDTMLSTIAPDAHLPSADSSFTSAAATASFSAANRSTNSASSTNSAASSRTHLTIPSRNHSIEALVPGCDTSDEEGQDDNMGSDTEDESIELNGPSRPRLHSTRRRPVIEEPPFRNPYHYSSSVRQRSRDASHFLENYYSRSFGEHTGSRSSRLREWDSPRRMDLGPLPSMRERESQPRIPEIREPVVDGPILDGPIFTPAHDNDTPVWRQALREAERDAPREDRELASPTVDDPELEHMRNVLERLAQRDDIPDDFWISAGLAPPLGERVQRLGRGRL